MSRKSPLHLLIAVLITALTFSVGCERSPQDLEDFRTSHGQLVDWAKSESEPMPVRIRAVQILVEEGFFDRLPAVFDDLEDDEVRATLANEAMPAVEALWQAQDVPELTDEMREGGARLEIQDYKTTRAVDSLYRLAPHLTGDAKERSEEILQEWMSRDQELRTQLANTSIPLLLPHAGEGAIEKLSDWIVDTYDPYQLVSDLRRRASDEAHLVIDAAVVERARAEHPELSMELRKSVNEAESEAIVPYLQEVIVDDQVDDEFFQIAINVIRDVLGQEAPSVLIEAVEYHKGPRRWATATNIVDVAGVAGLVTIAEALPTGGDGYQSERDDYVQSRFTYICNHTATLIDREEIDADPDSVAALLAGEQWPSRVLGTRCAARMNLTDFHEKIAKLGSDRTQIPLWGERKQVGQYAREISAALAEAE